MVNPTRHTTSVLPGNICILIDCWCPWAPPRCLCIICLIECIPLAIVQIDFASQPHIARKVILAADWRCLSCWSTVDPRAAMKNWFCMVLLYYLKRWKENVKVMKPFPVYKVLGKKSFDHIRLQQHSRAAPNAWQSCRLVLFGWSCSAGLVLGLCVWRQQQLYIPSGNLT